VGRLRASRYGALTRWNSAGGGNRTHTGGKPHGILRPKTGCENRRILRFSSGTRATERQSDPPNATAAGEAQGKPSINRPFSKASRTLKAAVVVRHATKTPTSPAHEPNVLCVGFQTSGLPLPQIEGPLGQAQKLFRLCDGKNKDRRAGGVRSPARQKQLGAQRPPIQARTVEAEELQTRGRRH
jgi:hypothetical protein